MATSSAFRQGGSRHGEAGVVDRGLGAPGWLTPLRARLGAARIDRQLAAGVPSWESPVYAARARQLTSPRMRTILADGIDRALEVTALDGSPALSSGAIAPYGPAVQQSRPMLLLLAARLRSPAPLSARGIAQLKALLCDGSGPLYLPSPQTPLAGRLRAIDELLDIVG